MLVQWKVSTQRMSIGYESGSDYTDPPKFNDMDYIEPIAGHR